MCVCVCACVRACIYTYTSILMCHVLLFPPHLWCVIIKTTTYKKCTKKCIMHHNSIKNITLLCVVWKITTFAYIRLKTSVVSMVCLYIILGSIIALPFFLKFSPSHTLFASIGSYPICDGKPRGVEVIISSMTNRTNALKARKYILREINKII